MSKVCSSSAPSINPTLRPFRSSTIFSSSPADSRCSMVPSVSRGDLSIVYTGKNNKLTLVPRRFPPAAELDSYLASIGSPTPKFVNPADHVIQLVNTEFMKPGSQHRSALEHLAHYSALWSAHASEKPRDDAGGHLDLANSAHLYGRRRGAAARVASNLRKLIVLMHRNLINYSRNLLAYGIRREFNSPLDWIVSSVTILSDSDVQSPCIRAWRYSSRRSGSISVTRPKKSTIVSQSRKSKSLVKLLCPISANLLLACRFFSVAFLGFMSGQSRLSLYRRPVLNRSADEVGIPSCRYSFLP